MRTATARRPVAASLVVAAGLLVSGCGLLPGPSTSLPPVPTIEPAPSGSADPGTQAQQCALLVAQISAIGADIARLPDVIATRIWDAPALLGSITDRIGELHLRVTDPALVERIEAIQAGWDALVEDAQASLAAGDTAGIDRAITAATELGEQVVALQEFCAGTA